MSAQLDDVALAELLARAAGRIAMAVRDDSGLSGKALGQAGDKAANTYLCQVLRELRPRDGLLSEECEDGAARLDIERVWIIDPVDGTREFAEGREDWAVHVALAVNGEPSVGAVAMPAIDRVFTSGDTPALPPAAEKPRMVVSRTRPAKEALAVAEAIGAELVPMGSAGAKTMAVLRGEAEIYLHTGGQYQWDNCAPVAVARAYGLHTSRVDGSPLVYNGRDTYMPDLLVCRPEWADRVLDLVAELA